MNGLPGNHPNLCTCKSFKSNVNQLRNNDLQLNANTSRANDSYLYMHVDHQTSQSTNSNNESKKKTSLLNYHVPTIDLSVEENVTKDGKAIKVEKEETNDTNKNFNMQRGSAIAVDNNDVMAAYISNDEEIYEIQDSTTPPLKREVNEVPQKKNETVSDNGSRLNQNFKCSEIKNAAINTEINNNIMQILEEESEENDNQNKLVVNASDVIRAKLFYDRALRLFRRAYTETVKSTKDQYTQTDNIKKENCLQTETQTINNNYPMNREDFTRQMNSGVNRNRHEHHTIIGDNVQQNFIPLQVTCLPESPLQGHHIMGQEVRRNAEPTMQAGLSYMYPPPADYNTDRPAVARHPYTSQHINRVRNPNGWNIYHPNIQPRSQYNQYATTQYLEWQMPENTNNYQNYYHNPYNNF